MFIGAHEAEYMFVTTLLKIEQHLLAQGRCPYKLFSYPPLIQKHYSNWGDVVAR